MSDTDGDTALWGRVTLPGPRRRSRLWRYRGTSCRARRTWAFPLDEAPQASEGGPQDPNRSSCNDFERVSAPEGRLWLLAWTSRIAEDREGYRDVGY